MRHRKQYFINPEELIFTHNLEEFATKTSFICNLESNQKLSPEEAYKRIKKLWKQLRKSKKSLHIGKPSVDGGTRR